MVLTGEYQHARSGSRGGIRSRQCPHEHDGKLLESGEAATSRHLYQRGAVPPVPVSWTNRSFRYNGRKLSDAERFSTSALIRDLLTYSQLSQDGGLDTVVDLREVLGETLFNLQAAIKETSATVSADALPAVPGRRGQLVQLFQNIIGNAIKYRSERPPHIQISVWPSEKNTWLFAVRDNGIGIDMQYAELIFGVFKRLHSGREYPGTGIGLASCKRIVEIHRGTIWVESQAGEGSTFYFRLPALAGVADATMAGKAGDICV